MSVVRWVRLVLLERLGSLAPARSSPDRPPHLTLQDDRYFLGYSSPAIVGVPLAIQIVPEFVTGKQLYDYIYNHLRRVLRDPVAVSRPQ